MKYFLMIFCIGAASHSVAQATLIDSAVYEPIKMLFAGMHQGDSAMVRRAFTASPIMATVGKDEAGNTTLRYGDLQKFLTAVGTPHAEAWSEAVWDTRIQSDGNLAQVWEKYAFYVGNRFSHCGVDAFQLFKDNDGKWKIFFVADTRQTEGCVVPRAIGEQFK
jgi:hypothetical protein